MRKVLEESQGAEPGKAWEEFGAGLNRVGSGCSEGNALGLWSFQVKMGMALINHPNFFISVFFKKLILFSALQTPDADV